MGSPPKPWEQGPASTVTAAATPAASTSSTVTPELPARPEAMSTTTVTNNSLTSRYGTSPYSRYVAGSFGGYGGYGGMGGMGYGGYGGYNSFGGGFGGYPGYGGSFGGDPNGARFPQLAAGTAATFQLIESIVGAFSGFAQMLESTYMATHSSFFAMVGVAEQLAHLRQYLGDIFSVVALWRLIKRVFGWGPQQDPSINAQQFQQFQQQGQGAPTGAKPSKKPLVIFLLTVFGLPWLMTKLIRIISAQSSSQQAALPPQQEVLDPSKLTFVRAAYPFTSISPNELSLTTDDIVAVLEKGQGWSRGRKRDGSIGWFPAKYDSYVTELPLNNKAKSQASPESAAVVA